MDNNRTATEILLSIENKINLFDKRLSNTESLLKILLSNFNKSITKNNNQLPVSVAVDTTPTIINKDDNLINKDTFDNRKKTNIFSDIANAKGISIEEELENNLDIFQEKVINYESDTSLEDSTSDKMTEASIRKSARGQRGPKSKVNKLSISQILKNGTSPLHLANIEILDNNGVLINQTRTNTKGRWLMTLEPGDYQVHVSKRYPPNSGKKSVDKLYKINIPPSDKPMELSPLSIDND